MIEPSLPPIYLAVAEKPAGAMIGSGFSGLLAAAIIAKASCNCFKANCYGLGNTLTRRAHLKVFSRNKKVKNLFYAGQLKVPGLGAPPSIIPGKIYAQLLIRYLNHHERTI